MYNKTILAPYIKVLVPIDTNKYSTIGNFCLEKYGNCFYIYTYNTLNEYLNNDGLFRLNKKAVNLNSFTIDLSNIDENVFWTIPDKNEAIAAFKEFYINILDDMDKNEIPYEIHYGVINICKDKL